MTRPYFLQRISARIARKAVGEDREPIRRPDHHDDLRISVLIFLSGAGLATLVLIGILGDRLFNVICGNWP